ncbi:pre-mRNA processing RNA-helicase [Apiotrichum porosum]|uniref:RNA helicase n=1 Tax=Apiotrichum porosum TaxID=105984 RepID=A0A427XHJ9_9TREE|nr:pre-mRNA processing RNA-helicase [Apiotrichum porosum]RSH78306.1 pre-mRNA processing RNA-helicase [Apiotrichum porosum]
MPRSPRRSRSPEQRRSSHRSYRSPSPSRYDRPRGDDRRERTRDDPRDRRRHEDDYDSRDRDRVRDRERDYRDRDRERDRYDRRRDDRDDRRRDDYRSDDRDRRRDDRDRDAPRDDYRRDRDGRNNGHAEPSRRDRSSERTPRSAMSGSPAAQSEEERLRLKRERLEAWKKSRELAKSRTASATPEPDKAAAAAPPKGESLTRVTRNNNKELNLAATAPPSAGAPGGGLSFSAQRIGFSIKPTPLKRSLALDDEETEDRKLQKLDLPDFAPEAQSGEHVEAVTADLAAEEADEKPDLANGQAKMEVDEEEEDPLDAFMRTNVTEVISVNKADAKRAGLIDGGDSEDDEPEIKNKAEEDLAKAEALLAMAASKSRKKDLPTPDHSLIDYEPFQKAFYNPPVEAAEMTDEDAELVRLEMDGIKIRGVDAPKPVKNWAAFGIPIGCLDVIRNNEWKEPTPIQAQSIPAIMMGRDVIGIAKTGSGKTIAFLLPLLRHVKAQRPVSGLDGPIALILAPTRELALQIHRESKQFAKVMNLRVSCCVGGQSISEDIAAMKKGAEIVVCTPGRMIDLLTANNGRVTNLRRVTLLVMDEADRMFDMGFEPQVMKIVNNTRPDAQKVLFSATFPKTMESLARKILIKPLEITVGGKSVVAAEIDQRVEVRDADTKFSRLLEILGEQAQDNPETDVRTLIFVERQESADDLFRDLLNRGYLSSSLHGGKDQIDRLEAIKNFKDGTIPIIVATSVAARGLDVKELKLVINYDAPNHMEDYIHRAGRTGRAGNTGVCITFITPEQEKFSVDLVRALEASKAFIPDKLKEMSDGFLGKIKSGKARAAGSGFAGKGLERLERKREEKDRAEKHTYGDTSEAISLSSREGAVIAYKPKTNDAKPHIESSGKGEGDYTFTEITVDVVHGPAPDKLPSGPAQRGTRAEAVNLPQQTLEALDKARREGRHIDAANLAKIASRLTQTIENNKKAAGLAAAIAPDSRGKTKDPDATDWHALFPINDYPQKARWKATHKEQMTLLQEISGASITMRGVYYPPGDEPAPGQEPKLHLLIESNEEVRVRRAVDELRRTLVEASVQALQSADRSATTGGRYAV